MNILFIVKVNIHIFSLLLIDHVGSPNYVDYSTYNGYYILHM